ncbi:MAG: sugar ABC transporter permease [Clostridiales bacterium]|jgi:multiple sugar transport system permease protein|nr:sugar ABC transporter permease [Clostridiales bacterium]
MEGTVKVVKKNASRRKEAVAGILFASPWLLGFLAFTLYPMAASLFYSFTNFNTFDITRYGVFNYAYALRDPEVRAGFRNTLYFVAVNVPASTVIGILYGWLLTRKTWGQKLYRTIVYLPAVVSLVAATFLWQFLLDQSGPVNRLLSVFGVSGPAWVKDPNWVKPGLLIMSAWGVGGTIILYLAAIGNVSAEQYEAARIDGAGGFRRFASITLPNISPIISYNVLMGFIGGFQYYLPSMMMDTDGAGRGGLFLGEIIYNNAFAQSRMGFASAVSWITMLLILLVTLIYLKVSDRFVYYAA